MLDELVRSVGPRGSFAIALTERIPRTRGEPNWVATFDRISDDARRRGERAVTELRTHDPLVNWGMAPAAKIGWRRVGKWQN
jgi:hypothetical protein